MVGITMMTRFVESSSSGFSDFLDYIAREEAVDPFAYSEYVSEYMDNPEKTYGLFTEMICILMLRKLCPGFRLPGRDMT